MASIPGQGLSEERLALLGLWAVPGIGSRSIGLIQAKVGSLANLLRQPVARWVALLNLPAVARQGLAQVDQLWPVAQRCLERVQRAQMGITFAGDRHYPERLGEIPTAPPLLFYRGPGGGPRRRVAMVGARKPGPGFEEFATAFAAQVAGAGVGIVSGAAEGVDTACHQGALKVHGETWAFLGSALDQLGAGARSLQAEVLARGGTFYSELPPGVRSERCTLPRRNRLISGAADLTLVMRARTISGALHTAKYAQEQGRPVMAMPGDVRGEAAMGCNQLIRAGARMCLEPSDVLNALGLGGAATLGLTPPEPVNWDEVSPEAKKSFAVLGRDPLCFEDVLAAARLPSSTLAAALCELELLGVIIQRPGKRYERL